MEDISTLAALLAGFASFLSPCVLPLVPIYLAGLAGPEILEAKGDKRNAHIFLHSLTFVAGFTLIFVLLGAGAGLLGFAVSINTFLIRRVASIVLIVFGALLLASLKIPQLNFTKHLAPSKGRATGFVRSFVTGLIFSAVMLPCVGPILGGILTLAVASETASRGAMLLGIYSLGVGIPFLIIGAAFDAVLPLLRRLQRYSGVIYIISGVVLIVFGILSLTGRLILLGA
ncbi:MAG: cytochrome c biogenesis protein CcdA [Dehalococcoidia bacterium]|jgi:cytochrome c-type biogenesis protein